MYKAKNRIVRRSVEGENIYTKMWLFAVPFLIAVLNPYRQIIKSTKEQITTCVDRVSLWKFNVSMVSAKSLKIGPGHRDI